MATKEDDFDIDIYGDGGDDYQQEEPHCQNTKGEDKLEHPAHTNDSASDAPTAVDQPTQPLFTDADGPSNVKVENAELQETAQKIASTDDSTQNPVQLPKQAPQTQGLKRQEGADDRFVEPGATTALFISELHWWVTDDDIRGWANQSECEDELEDMTFSEHKVNGKSKGQAYVLFKSPQAATAAKMKIESFGEGQQYTKKFTVSYTNPYTNPFRTLPKDGPMRNTNNNRTSGYQGGAGNHSQQSGYSANSSGGGYRGNRGGGYNNRGGSTNNYNRGGFQPPITGGFQGPSMNGFQGMGGMQPYSGFQNRGGMMGGMRGGAVGTRGGRGGMGANGMMAMPMGTMGLGNMGTQLGGLGMGMPQMGTGMGMQGMQNFQTHPSTSGSGHYSPMGIAPPGLRAHPNQSSHKPGSWASYTSYSQSPASIHSSSFPYQASASSTAVGPLQSQQSGVLTPNSSISGQGGFQGNQAHYNPAFFAQQQQGQQGAGAGDASWNPHGAKRTRQE